MLCSLHIRIVRASLLTFALLATRGSCFAQTAEEDPVAIVELGGAMGWNVHGGAVSFGPNLAVEVTPVENRLELEAGVTSLFTRNSTEWDLDFLFKRPWTLSRRAEFMLGLGPELVHTRQNGRTAYALALELATDFMFWPAKRHRFGWFVEPVYDYSFAHRHEQSIGMSEGLLIAIP